MSEISSRLRLLAVAAAALAGLIPGCGDDPAGAPILFNFHTIEENQAYRSSQLSGEALSWVIDHYGIKTVVNLRGPNPGKPWYDAEAEVCAEKNVVLVDLPMSARSLPEPELLESILQALRDSPRPLLIHCESGSDRSGAVSGLYRLDILGQDRETAMRELSPVYWHFRSEKPCMDTLVESYEPTPEWMDWYRAEYLNLECR
ncbi:MAG TPA: tyrosine-protein phosphatase [Phycisphaerae bacterium]|nr:tyrosine-protein phosphatase [Phycisphaerae bacterium]HOJ73455.1 tyrosine-protein phosphatase [Phycisphaerae bacterium]HOM51064.1 tyrosine-protein phosphatase [Phycisphaerae bacterium]HON66162.1 tyrosine-protein phosphatase [Phycisphaerae bacterium]HOQ86585.1 tyrosine-protein phosphatase [Phycisphaerae bacterium]